MLVMLKIFLFLPVEFRQNIKEGELVKRKEQVLCHSELEDRMGLRHTQIYR